LNHAPKNTGNTGEKSERPNELTPDLNFEFEALRHAHNYRKALIEEFGPYLRGTVIEVGAGIGQITEMISRARGVSEVVAVEPEAGFCRELAQRLPGLRLVCGTVDLLPPATQAGAIVCVNVLEHIREDAAELKKYRALLQQQGGVLCLFVPARQEIYAPMDRDFGHHRRYSRPELRAKLIEAGFEVQRLDYYNWLGYFAWWFNFCLLKKRAFNAEAVKFYDGVLFPAVHWMESRLCRPPFGQSLLAVAKATSR
jgi:SAM-dependent methyltransferase